MSPTSEVVARLERWSSETINQWADEYEPKPAWEKQVSQAMKKWSEASDEAAALISSLVAERDAALALNNRYAYERDKAREERDAAERRSEAHWKPRFEQAERLLAEAVEQAFRDGLAYGGNVENADADVAWLHSKARATLSTGGVNG